MSTREELTLRYEKVAEAGTVCITAWCNGVPIFTDKVDVTDAGGRKRFLGGLCDSRRGIDEQAVSTELEKIAGDVAAMGAALRDKPRKSQADSLVELAGVAELFHTPGGHDSEGYATVPIESHRETWPIASKAFRRWLARQFFRDQRKAPGAQALQDAINVLAGMAVHDGPELSVAVRIAEHGGAIYVDLADAEWRVVEIAADGWRVITDPPVRFIRRGGELALPVPTSGGSIDDLRRLVNVPDDDAWHLVVGWIIAAFRPGKPFTILVVTG